MPIKNKRDFMKKESDNKRKTTDTMVVENVEKTDTFASARTRGNDIAGGRDSENRAISRKDRNRLAEEHNDKPTTHKCKHCTAGTNGNHTDEKTRPTLDHFERFVSTAPRESIEHQMIQMMNDMMSDPTPPVTPNSRVLIEPINHLLCESIRTNLDMFHEMINARMFFDTVHPIPLSKGLVPMTTSIDTMYPLGVCGDMSAETRAPDEKQSSSEYTRTLYDMIHARTFDTVHPILLGAMVPAVEKPHVKTKIPAATKTTVAKIRCGRVMINDAKIIEIREFIGIMRMDDLPEEYMMGRPMVAIDEDDTSEYLLIRPADSRLDSIALEIGDRLSYKEYVRLLKIMAAAGQRLTDINAKAKRAKAFSGEFVVTI